MMRCLLDSKNLRVAPLMSSYTRQPTVASQLEVLLRPSYGQDLSYLSGQLLSVRGGPKTLTITDQSAPLPLL